MVAKKPSAGSQARSRAAFDALLERVAQLEDRVRSLEAERDAAVGAAAAFAAPAVVVMPPLPAPAAAGLPLVPARAPAEPVSEEILLVIAAAVAAFLGERAHVRQVRLLSSPAWAQQGRVSVMASHRWAVHRS